MTAHPALLRVDDTVIVAIDLQTTLLRVIHDADRVVDNAILLLRSAGVLDVPVIGTTQNAARLGRIDDYVVPHLSRGPIVDKMAFSAARVAEFISALSGLGRKQVVLCGIETHVCITQTALDLIAAGFQVHVAVDAVSSRSMERHKLGMERLRDNGALPIASESVVYELLGEAGTHQFKQILPLVK